MRERERILEAKPAREFVELWHRLGNKECVKLCTEEAEPCCSSSHQKRQISWLSLEQNKLFVALKEGIFFFFKVLLGSPALACC